MSNTNDDTNMTGNADNCDSLRTKSGQDGRLKVAAHTEEQIRVFCRSHQIPRPNVVRIRRPEDLYGWRSHRLLLLPSWWLGTNSDTVPVARDRGWEIADVTEDEVLNGPKPPAPAEDDEPGLTFGEAWDIQHTAGPSLDHDPKCSSVPGHHPLSGPALLCDCGAIEREWKRRRATPPAERPTPITDAEWQTQCCSGASWYCIAERIKNLALILERQLAEARSDRNRMTERFFPLKHELAEVTRQRDEAHQKCRDYRLVALGAEDALERMTAQRDALVEALEVAMARAYAAGYQHGHDDSVEARFIIVDQAEAKEHFAEDVKQMLLDGSQPEAAAALAAVKGGEA